MTSSHQSNEPLSDLKPIRFNSMQDILNFIAKLEAHGMLTIENGQVKVADDLGSNFYVDTIGNTYFWPDIINAKNLDTLGIRFKAKSAGGIWQTFTAAELKQQSDSQRTVFIHNLRLVSLLQESLIEDGFVWARPDYFQNEDEQNSPTITPLIMPMGGHNDLYGILSSSAQTIQNVKILKQEWEQGSLVVNLALEDLIYYLNFIGPQLKRSQLDSGQEFQKELISELEAIYIEMLEALAQAKKLVSQNKLVQTAIESVQRDKMVELPEDIKTASLDELQKRSDQLVDEITSQKSKVDYSQAEDRVSKWKIWSEAYTYLGGVAGTGAAAITIMGLVFGGLLVSGPIGWTVLAAIGLTVGGCVLGCLIAKGAYQIHLRRVENKRKAAETKLAELRKEKEDINTAIGARVDEQITSALQKALNKPAELLGQLKQEKPVSPQEERLVDQVDKEVNYQPRDLPIAGVGSVTDFGIFHNDVNDSQDAEENGEEDTPSLGGTIAKT